VDMAAEGDGRTLLAGKGVTSYAPRGDVRGDVHSEDWPMNQSVDLPPSLPAPTVATLGTAPTETF